MTIDNHASGTYGGAHSQQPASASSQALARLIGPTLVAMAVSLLLNRSVMPELAHQISRDWGIIFMSGVLLLLAGIAIVDRHNVWHGGWPVAITLLGWLAIVGGLIRMLFFSQLADIAGRVVAHPQAILFPILALAALGAFLSLKGFGLRG